MTKNEDLWYFVFTMFTVNDIRNSTCCIDSFSFLAKQKNIINITLYIVSVCRRNNSVYIDYYPNEWKDEHFTIEKQTPYALPCNIMSDASTQTYSHSHKSREISILGNRPAS